MASSAPPPFIKVLYQDLDDLNVIARIAKRGVFTIKDRPEWTPELRDKIRDMLHRLRCSQPVDPNDLEAKLRDCPPRLSPADLKAHDLPVEGYYSPINTPPSNWETPVDTPRPPEEVAEHNKNSAEEYYNTLIQMGGRPTGPIRPIPPWKKVLGMGEYCYHYAERPKVLFYSTWHGNAPDSAPGSTEAGYCAAHWRNECKRFREEIRRWQGFHDAQQWRREHRPEFAREEEMERQRYPQDPDLTTSLKKLKDWKEYQVYFQRGIDKCKERIEGARRAVEAIQRKDPEVVANKGKVRGMDDSRWLRFIETKREWVAAEEKRLEWAKQQLPAVLSECAALLMGAPTSRREMEERSELEAKRVFNTLVETGGRPTRPIRPVPDIQEREHTDECLHALCHWEGEYRQFEEELKEWKKFLDYRQKKEADGRTEAQLEEQQSAETTTQVDLWKDYRAYQQLEVDNAKQWVVFWQRQVEDYQEIENDAIRQAKETERDGLRRLCEGTACRYHSIAEDARSHVEEMRKQVGPAQSRLEWADNELLLACLAEGTVSTTEVSTCYYRNDQAKLSKRASRPGQSTLKDLRSNRPDKSAPRSNLDHKKRHASANSALGPIYSSRVLKAAGRKAPPRRRQSKILTEHGDGQNQGPNTIISPSLPAKVAPHRSCRLSNSQKRSDAVDLDRSAGSPPTNIILRRSDRMSKQKERMSTSTSRPKGCLAGDKSDIGSVKPRGISKRQRNHPSRNRTKIHG